MITPVAFTNINNYTYAIFAIINLLMVPSVWLFYPETAGRSLEEMDVIFQKVSGWRAALDVVRQADVEPHRYGKKGELLIAVNEVGEKGHVEHHRGEDSSEGSVAPNAAVFTSTDEENQRREK